MHRRASPGRNGLFPGSSVVERSTVNRMVAGSNPARGATSRIAEHVARQCRRSDTTRTHHDSHDDTPDDIRGLVFSASTAGKSPIVGVAIGLQRQAAPARHRPCLAPCAASSRAGQTGGAGVVRRQPASPGPARCRADTRRRPEFPISASCRMPSSSVRPEIGRRSHDFSLSGPRSAQPDPFSGRYTPRAGNNRPARRPRYA